MPNLVFLNEDPLEHPGRRYDVAMAIDVSEHIEDYMGFLRSFRRVGRDKIFHIPLDLSVQTVIRSSALMKERSTVGHLHYFSKETALATLRDCGYEIRDHFYTCKPVEMPNREATNRFFNLFRKAFSAFDEDMAARVFGRFSLMVLAR